ncbi:hypothetical protein ABT346_28790 [Micromonospora peucetia]|uniref:hypothetical protein n=1 Tax=Micromonospora peucetia TaxID=47871 RepID=UPI003326CCE0
MFRRTLTTLAAALLGLSALAAPAEAAPAAEPAALAVGSTLSAPTGCTTSIEWVVEGSSYYQGRGKVTCSTGRYKVKIQCRNAQTGVGYVVYGTEVVNAPSTATTTCYSGNVAEQVYAVQDPPGTGITGCAPWKEWVHEGSSHYSGRGRVQCDTGSYRVKIQCRNAQTGVGYVVYGTEVVNAPSIATTTCYSGNVAEQVYAVQDPPGTGITGCAPWMEWVHEGIKRYYGRGSVQCDTGSYRVQIQCRNLQTGVTYVVYGPYAVSAPDIATTTCYSGNVAEAVVAVP